MEKERIEIKRIENFISGYGHYATPSYNEQLEKLIEYSKNKDILIYSHSITEEFIPYTDGKYRESHGWIVGGIPNQIKTSNQWTFGDLVFYLDIYYQTK